MTYEGKRSRVYRVDDHALSRDTLPQFLSDADHLLRTHRRRGRGEPSQRITEHKPSRLSPNAPDIYLLDLQDGFFFVLDEVLSLRTLTP